MAEIEHDPRLIQPTVPLRESSLWEIEKHYFDNMGIEAWRDEVPMYISSNAFIGHQYAMQMLCFIKDCHANNIDNTKEGTFYILELGSATGSFSFHFLNAFKKLLQEYKIAIKFCYIISDKVEANVKFIRENPAFLAFEENQEVDYAVYDLEVDEDVVLMVRGKKYSEIAPGNKYPLAVIANYIFDCTRQDHFISYKGGLEEVRWGIHSRYKNFDVKQGKHLNELRFSHDYKAIEAEHYYSNPDWNMLLKNYQLLFSDSQAPAQILMPLGAFAFFGKLRSFTNDRFFMILGDKGLAQTQSFPLLEIKDSCSFDGIYSFMVNFHAIASMLQGWGAQAILTQSQNDFKVNLLGMGFDFENFKETQNFFHNTLEVFGPHEYCYIYDEFEANNFRLSLKSILSFLKLSRWDPRAYVAVHDRLMELMPNAGGFLKENIFKAVAQIQKNIYRLDFGADLYNIVGLFYYRQDKNSEALEMFESSLGIRGESSVVHYNIGLVYEREKKLEKALFHYEKSYDLDPKNSDTKLKLSQLGGKPYRTLLMPILKAVLVFGAIFIFSYFNGFFKVS